MRPKKVNMGQIGSNGAKWGQTEPIWAKRGQTGSKRAKWVQTRPNRAKQCHIGPTGANWVPNGCQTIAKRVPNRVKWSQMGPNGSKYDKQAQQGSNVFTWGKHGQTVLIRAEWGQSEPNGA